MKKVPSEEQQAVQILKKATAEAEQKLEKKTLFEHTPVHLYLLSGFLITFICSFLPQFIPFGLIVLVYLAVRSKYLIFFGLFFGLLTFFIPVIERSDWYCSSCAAYRQTNNLYGIQMNSISFPSPYAEWYQSLVEHKEHRWELNERVFRNIINSDIGKIGDTNKHPFLGLEIRHPKPPILQLLKPMPPREALQIFVNWEELCQMSEFRTTFEQWRGQSSSYFEWVKRWEPTTFKKIQFILKSSIKPFPKLDF